MTKALRLTASLLAALAAVTLYGCDTAICFGSICLGGSPPPPQDQPGSFSYYAIMSYTGQDNLCLGNGGHVVTGAVNPDDPNCFWSVNNNFAQPLTSKSWAETVGDTDGYISGNWTTATTEAQVLADHSNLVFILSHGYAPYGAANSMICLRNCDSVTIGGTSSIVSSDMVRWNGSNWLIVDGCDAVQPFSGWESTFGGSLHGVLGYRGLTSPMSAAGLTTLANLIAGYDTAMDAWEQANRASWGQQNLGMYIPNANKPDAIERAGGPHFGPNGSTAPVFYYCCDNLGNATPGSISRLPSASSQVYSLTPETMNETYWYNLYGGGNVSSRITYPSNNEHLYRNPYVMVDHFLASGGLIVAAPPTGTGKGFSQDDALSYAQSWVSSNGGWPSDATLSYAGAEIISPTQLPVDDGAPYPQVRQYVFKWRHGQSGVILGDKLEVAVDDHGTWTVACTRNPDPPYNPRCYLTTPWKPSFHIVGYTRVWRSIASSVRQITRLHTYTVRQPLVPSTPGNALCSSDMTDPNSIAKPCDMYLDSTGTVNGYVDPSTAGLLGTSEKL